MILFSQFYGSPLGALIIIGGGLSYGYVRRLRSRREARRIVTESLGGRFRRVRMSRWSFDTFVLYALAGVLGVIDGISTHSDGVTGVGVLLIALSVGVTYFRWGWRRPRE